MLYQTPAVVTYTHRGREQLYVFVVGSDGYLYVRLWDRQRTTQPYDHWRWDRAAQGAPPGTTVVSGPSVIKSVQVGRGFQEELLYAFVTGEDGHLWVRYWTGEEWLWADLGSPSDVRAVDGPGAVTYTRVIGDPADEGLIEAFQRMYVFVRGDDGGFYTNRWNGNDWRWLVQDSPPGASIASASGTLIYPLGGSDKRVYAFAPDNNGRLQINFSDGFHTSGALAGELHFFWHNGDKPELRTIVNRPSVINFANGNPYAFVTSAEGHLDLYFWDGSDWYWHYGGQPAGVAVASEPAVVSFVHEGELKLYAFVTGNDGQLYEYHWSASAGWAWADQPHSPPQGVTLASGPAAIVYRYENREQIYIFIMDSEGQLRERHWNADSGLWEWGYPHGAP